MTEPLTPDLNPQAADAPVPALSHTPDEERVMQMFREMDVDGSGSIEVEELIHMMGADGIDDLAEEVRSLFEKLDTNGDGRLDLEEFRRYMQML